MPREELERIQLLIRRTHSLPPLPQAVQALIRAIDRGDSGAVDLERIIISDPVLTTDFLKLAPIIGGHDVQALASIRPIIMRMGFRAVRNLALSLLVRRCTASAPFVSEFDRDAFSQSCLATATLSRYLHMRQAQLGKESVWSGDELFSAGLLSNLGYVLLSNVAPDSFHRCWSLAKHHGMTVSGAYALIFGEQLTNLAGMAAETWQLPDVFQTVLSNLESPWRSEVFQDEVSCVSMAHSLAYEYGYPIERWPCAVEAPIEVKLAITLSDEEKEAVRAWLRERLEGFHTLAAAA